MAGLKRTLMRSAALPPLRLNGRGYDEGGEVTPAPRDRSYNEWDIIPPKELPGIANDPMENRFLIPRGPQTDEVIPSERWEPPPANVDPALPFEPRSIPWDRPGGVSPLPKGDYVQPIGYQRGGPVRPTHAHRNDQNQRMIANAARRDPYKAARLMQGLRREHNGLRHLGAQALGQSAGLRTVGRHELAHGHDAYALHLLNHAHAKVPDGAEVNFSQHDDHHFNANVKRNGRERNYPLSRDQMMQWAIGPPGSFDHSMTNGVEKNLGILTNPRRGRGPVQGYQGGGLVTDDDTISTGYTGDYDPSMDTYAPPDDDRTLTRKIYDWWQGLHFGGGGEGGAPSSIRDYVHGTGEHSAPPEEIDAERQTLAPTRAPTSTGERSYDPFSLIRPEKSPLQWGGGRPEAPQPTERTFTPEEREAQRAEEAERTRVTATPFETPAEQIPAILRPGGVGGGIGTLEPPEEVRMPGAKHLEQYDFDPRDLTPEQRQQVEQAQRTGRQQNARQQYIDRMTPQWQKDADWLDKEIEDQIRKGLIKPGEMPRNLAQERKAQRWPLGGGSESRGLFHDEVTRDMRNYTAADRAAGAYDQRLVNAMNAKRALAGNVEEIPSVGGVGTFKAPLSREPQARDVVPSDIYGRSRAAQATQGVRPPTQFEPGFIPGTQGPGFGGLTPGPGELTRRQNEWMERLVPYERPAWQPAPNIRGAVGLPPPADDMSLEARAARLYPSASQALERRDYEVRQGRLEALDALEREKLASAERRAIDTAESRERIAAQRSADYQARTAMFNDQNAVRRERIASQYLGHQEKLVFDDYGRRFRADPSVLPTPEEQRVIDKVRHGAAMEGPQQSEQTNRQQEQQQQQAREKPTADELAKKPAKRPGFAVYFNPTTRQWIEVPVQ